MQLYLESMVNHAGGTHLYPQAWEPSRCQDQEADEQKAPAGKQKKKAGSRRHFCIGCGMIDRREGISFPREEKLKIYAFIDRELH